jgi:predicted GNAT family acetyltransferase
MIMTQTYTQQEHAMPDVQHQPDHNRFVIEMDGETSSLTYRHPQGSAQVDFDHTFVPPSLRHHGLARQLVDTGLAWARGQGYEIRASCSYVDAVIRRGG